MQTITLESGKRINIHSTLKPDVLAKALDIIERCENKELKARAIVAFAKGLSVLDVNLRTRIVIDKRENYHCMTHEKYNNFIARR